MAVEERAEAAAEKPVVVWLEMDVHRWVKIRAATEGMTMKEFVDGILRKKMLEEDLADGSYK